MTNDSCCLLLLLLSFVVVVICKCCITTICFTCKLFTASTQSDPVHNIINMHRETTGCYSFLIVITHLHLHTKQLHVHYCHLLDWRRADSDLHVAWKNHRGLQSSQQRCIYSMWLSVNQHVLNLIWIWYETDEMIKGARETMLKMAG